MLRAHSEWQVQHQSHIWGWLHRCNTQTQAYFITYLYFSPEVVGFAKSRIYWSIWKWFSGRNCEGIEKRGNDVHRMLANNWLSTSIIKSIPKLKVQILQKKWSFSRFMRIPETVLINSSSLISSWLLKVPWTSAIFPSYTYDTQNILLWIIVICGLVYFSVIKWASKSWWLSIRALRSELV